MIAEAWTEARREVKRRTTPPVSFQSYIARVNPTLLKYAHVRKLVNVLQRVADDELKRLMVFEPPRHFKSETVSRLFSAYFLARYPDRWVGINSYAADLAYALNRNAREIFNRADGAMSNKAAGVMHWETTAGGGAWAAGVGGSITGKGFHLGIIDDPIKNAEEAASEVIREKHKDWYKSTFYTRAEPDAAIIVINTRWHQDDLSGWLLKQEEQEPEHWHIVCLPAIASAATTEFPVTCTVEPDDREPGEALCPERYDEEALRRIRNRLGTYFWSALYDQSPTNAEGAILKRHWFRFWHVAGSPLPPVPVQSADGTWLDCPCEPLPPTLDETIQSWDMAFKDADTSSYVVGQVWGREYANVFLLDERRDHLDIVETITAVNDMSKAWPKAHVKLVEDKANGPAVIQLLHNRLAGLIAESPEGSKESRTQAIAPIIESGNIYLPHPLIKPWVKDFIEEVCAFPYAAHDDRVDAMSQALGRLAQAALTDGELEELFGYL